MKIRPGLCKINFHQRNARFYISVVQMVILNELKYNLLQHSSYLPTLALSVIQLFLVKEVKAVVYDYFEGLEKLRFRDSVMDFEHHWMKCIELKKIM